MVMVQWRVRLDLFTYALAALFATKGPEHCGGLSLEVTHLNTGQ